MGFGVVVKSGELFVVLAEVVILFDQVFCFPQTPACDSADLLDCLDFHAALEVVANVIIGNAGQCCRVALEIDSDDAVILVELGIEFGFQGVEFLLVKRIQDIQTRNADIGIQTVDKSETGNGFKVGFVHGIVETVDGCEIR